MSTFGDFITVAKSEIVANTSFSVSAANVLLTEGIDLVSQPDTAFPRVEIDVEYAQAVGYESQRDLRWMLRFWFTGYLRRTDKQDEKSNIWTAADFANIWDFGLETLSSVMGIMDYHQDTPIANFQMFDGNPFITVDCEMIPYISTFLARVDAIFIKSDTEE